MRQNSLGFTEKQWAFPIKDPEFHQGHLNDHACHLIISPRKEIVW